MSLHHSFCTRIFVLWYGEKKLYGLNYNNNKNYIDLLFNTLTVDTTDKDLVKIGLKNKFNNYVMYNDYSNLPDIANMFIELPP